MFVSKKPGNILLVANYASNVGFAWWLMENFWLQISEQNKEKKCVLIYPEINSIPDSIRNSNLIIDKGDINSNFLSLLFLVHKYKIKYIYLTDRAYYHWKYLVLNSVGVRKIILHDHMPGERTPNNIFKNFLKKFIHFLRIFSCDYYIGVSKFVKDRLVEVGCVPEGKVEFIHNGIVLFDNQKTEYANEIFNIPKGSKIIVSTGRATFYKGIDILIRAASIVVKEKGHSNIYFLHLGSGPDLDEFKKLASHLDLDEVFIFGGFRKDVQKILPSCDFGIQTSLGEAFSLSILEYMWAGLVTIVPNNCGNPEAIQDGINGLLFKPGCVDDVVDKILFALNNESIANGLRMQAKSTVFNKFSLDKCNEKFNQIISEQFK